MIKFVAKHLFNYRLSFKCPEDEDKEDWDIYWSDTSMQAERMAKMKPY